MDIIEKMFPRVQRCFEACDGNLINWKSMAKGDCNVIHGFTSIQTEVELSHLIIEGRGIA
jgi:hypothetical protein